ncbi:hypothetical protein [Ancylobacter amanitiformis]|uniref:SMODS and SLOG-associating 2TM effector domain-containing protein n=1 Tax=Ancylobacter amanitiformis TaxID=217069 RepID=A0ABU0LSE1_9HYPH|nr:hypothetical protein [Ancylobacter amanitiformis]MDQ0511589.1 hypothetical protein [Ancylobacter amanitiformis]
MIPLPQKPEISLSIGLVGHHLADLPESARASMVRSVGSTLAAIDGATRRHRDAHQGIFAPADPRLRLLAGLAEGADPAVLEALPAGWQGFVLLPFARERCREALTPGTNGDRDLRPAFDAALVRATAVIELPEDGRGAESEAAGSARLDEFLVHQSDLLVAVWDGRPAMASGGTAQVVARALGEGIPVIWIAPDTDAPPRVITALADIDRAAELADATNGPIAAAIAGLFALPPTRKADESHSPESGHRGVTHRRGTHLDARPADVVERLREFYVERPPATTPWPAYAWLERGWRFWTWPRRIVHRDLDATYKSWQGFFERAPDAGPFTRDMRAVLVPRCTTAEALAAHYAMTYRSACVMGYLLAVVAVLLALIGLAAGGEEGATGVAAHVHALMGSAGLAVGQIAAIGLIAFVVSRGRRGRWRAKARDYRALAQALHTLRFLGLLGAHDALRRPVDVPHREDAWVVWYIRATLRELGPPGAVLDTAYQQAVLAATHTADLIGQINHHQARAHRLSGLERGLRRTVDRLFAGTALLLLGFLAALLVVRLIGPQPAPWQVPIVEGLHALRGWIGFFAVLLPVLGLTLAGIRFADDLAGLAARSRATADALKHLQPAYARALAAPDITVASAALAATARAEVSDGPVGRTFDSARLPSVPA